MKFSYLKFLFILGALSFFVSCGDDESKKKDDDDENENLADYYIQFKMDGVLKTFEVNEPGYQACGSCACCGIPPLSSRSASLMVCNESEDFSVGDIENLESNSLEFSVEDFPGANLSFTLDGVYYDTQYVSDQTGSTFTVTDVSSDGLFGGQLQMLKVEGTFQCTIRAEDDDTDIEITEGKFIVRFSEN